MALYGEIIFLGKHLCYHGNMSKTALFLMSQIVLLKTTGVINFILVKNNCHFDKVVVLSGPALSLVIVQ